MTVCHVRAVDLGEGSYRAEVWRGGREVYRATRGGPDAELRARAAAWSGYLAKVRHPGLLERVDVPAVALADMRAAGGAA